MEAESAFIATIVAIVVIVVGLILITVYFAVRDKRRKSLSGREALVGEIGEARSDIAPEGRVLVHGEWWSARSADPIPAGSKVRVVRADKMLLHVEKAPEDA